MTVGIEMVEDAWLLGYARFQEWKGKWQQEFYEALGRSLVMMNAEAIRQMSPEQRKQLRSMNPEAFDQMIATVEELKR